MYHCHVRFYLAGGQCGIFEIVRSMPPLEHFTHEFLENGEEASLAGQADVILALLPAGREQQAVQTLLVGKRPEAALIVLAESGQISLLTEFLPELEDIWTLPMQEEEVRFRFHRWQQGCKRDKDFWQTSHFLDATIDNTPNLIWYKDKEGIHEKVNESFCRTVNKTKKQVQGRGHAYILDVEQDDPACIESERVVMTRRETCISEEMIRTGEGNRLLTTYKSPLYDLDGSVMGTVGVAIDVTQERAYEKEIVRKNDTLEKIFTTMECGVMCHSVDGARIISINRAALTILGYESQEEIV